MTITGLKIRRNLFREEEPEWLVWVLVILLLAAGLLVRSIIVNQSADFTQGNLSVRYPAAWTPMAGDAEDAVLVVGEPFDAGLFPARLTLRQIPVADISTSAQTLGDFALVWADRKAKDLLGYRVLSIEEMKVRDKDAVRVNYVYVAEPVMAAPNSVPIVAEGADILVRQNDVMTVASLLASADTFESLDAAWDRILGSLELQ